MHILVILRLVPDVLEDLPLNEEGKAVDRDEVGLRLNEFDDYALEEAVLLKEASGGSVTALALAGDGIDRVLQTAIARGADRAIRLDAGITDPSSATEAAAAVAGAISDLAVDLVLTGVQTPEDVFGQLVPELGERLQWPHVSGVTAVAAAGSGAIRIQQEYGGGRAALLEVDLPAAIGMQASSKPPRYVSGSRLRQAIQSSQIEAYSVKPALASVAGEIVALQESMRGQGAEFIEGTPEEIVDRLLAILRERGFGRAAA
jgi:electron transfer flavoprotein beta subunit